MTSDLKNGGVYHIPPHQIRIIAFDQYEILYEDGYFGGWKSNKLLDSGFFFGRLITGAFKAKDNHRSIVEPYSAAVNAILRPDLPISMGRSLEDNWASICTSDYEEFVHKMDEGFKGSIPVDKLIVYPFGPAGGLKKAHLIKSDNDQAFTIREIVWKSAQIQCTYYKSTEGGIGLFRAGIKNKIPSYYVYDYYSRAEAYRKFEEGFDWEMHYKSESSRS